MNNVDVSQLYEYIFILILQSFLFGIITYGKYNNICQKYRHVIFLSSVQNRNYKLQQLNSLFFFSSSKSYRHQFIILCKFVSNTTCILLHRLKIAGRTALTTQEAASVATAANAQYSRHVTTFLDFSTLSLSSQKVAVTLATRKSLLKI